MGLEQLSRRVGRFRDPREDFALSSLFTSSSNERISQVLQSVTRVQEVALLSLHIEGVARHESNGEIRGVAVPASEKTTLIQYRFDAKLGIDGSQVQIEPTGPESFRVTIPEFIGIGFDDPVFEDPLESNDALSWLAPPVVQTRIINNILSDENKQKYITQNEAALKEQAQVFYSGIVESVDPEITIGFEFAGQMPAAPRPRRMKPEVTMAVMSGEATDTPEEPGEPAEWDPPSSPPRNP